MEAPGVEGDPFIFKKPCDLGMLPRIPLKSKTNLVSSLHVESLPVRLKALSYGSIAASYESPFFPSRNVGLGLSNRLGSGFSFLSLFNGTARAPLCCGAF